MKAIDEPIAQRKIIEAMERDWQLGILEEPCSIRRYLSLS